MRSTKTDLEYGNRHKIETDFEIVAGAIRNCDAGTTGGRETVAV